MRPLADLLDRFLGACADGMIRAWESRPVRALACAWGRRGEHIGGAATRLEEASSSRAARSRLARRSSPRFFSPAFSALSAASFLFRRAMSCVAVAPAAFASL